MVKKVQGSNFVYKSKTQPEEPLIGSDGRCSFDVTNYAKYHKGGPKTIAENAGRLGAAMDAFHSKMATSKLARMKKDIGPRKKAPLTRKPSNEYFNPLSLHLLKVDRKTGEICSASGGKVPAKHAAMVRELGEWMKDRKKLSCNYGRMSYLQNDMVFGIYEGALNSPENTEQILRDLSEYMKLQSDKMGEDENYFPTFMAVFPNGTGRSDPNFYQGDGFNRPEFFEMADHLQRAQVEGSVSGLPEMSNFWRGYDSAELGPDSPKPGRRAPYPMALFAARDQVTYFQDTEQFAPMEKLIHEFETEISGDASTRFLSIDVRLPQVSYEQEIQRIRNAIASIDDGNERPFFTVLAQRLLSHGAGLTASEKMRATSAIVRNLGKYEDPLQRKEVVHRLLSVLDANDSLPEGHPNKISAHGVERVTRQLAEAYKAALEAGSPLAHEVAVCVAAGEADLDLSSLMNRFNGTEKDALAAALDQVRTMFEAGWREDVNGVRVLDLFEEPAQGIFNPPSRPRRTDEQRSKDVQDAVKMNQTRLNNIPLTEEAAPSGKQRKRTEHLDRLIQSSTAGTARISGEAEFPSAASLRELCAQGLLSEDGVRQALMILVSFDKGEGGEVALRDLLRDTGRAYRQATSEEHRQEILGTLNQLLKDGELGPGRRESLARLAESLGGPDAGAYEVLRSSADAGEREEALAYVRRLIANEDLDPDLRQVMRAELSEIGLQNTRAVLVKEKVSDAALAPSPASKLRGLAQGAKSLLDDAIDVAAPMLYSVAAGEGAASSPMVPLALRSAEGLAKAFLAHAAGRALLSALPDLTPAPASPADKMARLSMADHEGVDRRPEIAERLRAVLGLMENPEVRRRLLPLFQSVEKLERSVQRGEAAPFTDAQHDSAGQASSEAGRAADVVPFGSAFIEQLSRSPQLVLAVADLAGGTSDPERLQQAKAQLQQADWGPVLTEACRYLDRRVMGLVRQIDERQAETRQALELLGVRDAGSVKMLDDDPALRDRLKSAMNGREPMLEGETELQQQLLRDALEGQSARTGEVIMDYLRPAERRRSPSPVPAAKIDAMIDRARGASASVPP